MKILITCVLGVSIPMLALACSDGGNNDDDGSGASSAGGQVGSGGSGGSNAEAEAAFVAACQTYCEAYVEPMCSEAGFTEDECKAICPTQPALVDEACWSSYVDLYQCYAEGGTECFENKPVPKEACAEEAQAYGVCGALTHCRTYCKGAYAKGCGGASEEACAQQCATERLATQGCANEHDVMLQCMIGEGVKCSGSQQAVGGCGKTVLDVSECIAAFDSCAGYCWAANRYGCGDGCASDCSGKLADPNCSFQYQNYLDCVIGADSGLCQDGTFEAAQCADLLNSYNLCTGP